MTEQLLRSRNAAAAAFFFNGFITASWLSRIPAVSATLALSPRHLGLLLLGPGLGSVLSLPLAGQVVLHLGARRAIRAFAVVCAGGIAVAGAGVSSHHIPLAAIGLFSFGLGTGMWDVAMNVEGAAVEQLMGRSIMPRFHAGWSIGAVTGALLGAGAAAIDLPLVVHLGVVAVAAVICTQLACHWFLESDPHNAPGQSESAPPRAALRAWTERRTLLIGVLTLCAGLDEGIANDWFGLSLVKGYHQSQSVGALGFGVFVAMMTVGRSVGTSVIDRLGRVRTLRVSAFIAGAGVLLVVIGPWVGIALAGGLLWGAGAALGFPMGMSAAADDPAMAAPRLGVAASIGYVAFLAGPPFVGFIAGEVGVRRAIGVVLAVLVVMVVLAPAERELLVGRRSSEAPDGARDAAPSGNGESGLTS